MTTETTYEPKMGAMVCKKPTLRERVGCWLLKSPLWLWREQSVKGTLPDGCHFQEMVMVLEDGTCLEMPTRVQRACFVAWREMNQQLGRKLSKFSIMASTPEEYRKRFRAVS